MSDVYCAVTANDDACVVNAGVACRVVVILIFVVDVVDVCDGEVVVMEVHLLVIHEMEALLNNVSFLLLIRNAVCCTVESGSQPLLLV